MRRRRTITLIPLLLAGLFAAFQYFTAERVTNPETGRTSRVALSSDQEEALGLQSFREVIAQNEVVASGPEHQLVERVTRKLVAAVGESGKDFNWQVTVLRSDQANAFCLPGGKIAVYTGILPYTRDEAGLAAVLGHEMAHAIGRHGGQRLLRNSVTQTMVMGASMSFSDLDWNQRRMVLAALGAGAQFGVILPFSRGHETEADEMGLLYMARAGYDPAAAIEFWERMSATGGQQPMQLVSTHPSHTARIEHLRAFLPKAHEEFTRVKQAR